MNLKWVVVGLALIIVALLALIWIQHDTIKMQNKATTNTTGLLSPRIYSRILPAHSFLILNFVPLKKELEQHIHQQNLTMSIYLVNLRDGASLGIDSRLSFRPASLSKVPVAILMMRKVEERELSLDTPLEISNENRVDSSGTLHLSNETKIPLQVLIQSMLQESDNTALKVFLGYLGQDEQKILDEYWDYFSIDALSSKNSEAGLITPRSMYNVFQSLYLSTILEPEHSEFILNLLSHTVFDINKVAQLPENVRVSHKYGVGEYPDMKVFHDCGIMYINDMRIFYCIMTRDLDQKAGIREVGYAVHTIYNYVINTRETLDVLKEK